MAEERGVIKYESRGQEVVLTAAIVKEFLVTGKRDLVSNQEIAYFLAQCKAKQMNPFVRDCYLVKFDANPAAIIVAIDYYRSRARAAADCMGWEAGVICLHKTTGDLRYSKGLVLPDEELVGGWFRARPKGWSVDCELEVNLSGYAKDNAFWKGGKAATMLAKVAESQGLRRAWPDLFQGTYTSEEVNVDLDSIDTLTPPPAGSPGDVTPKPQPDKLDTSKFDRAVKKLKFSKEQLERLEKWLNDTATGASNKSGKDITPDMIKASCAARFEEFRAKFKEWQGVNFPVPTQETDPEPDVKEPAAAAGPPENEWPPEAAGADKSFSQEQMEAWHAVISSGTPLSALQEIGVSRAADVTPDNIEQVLALAEKFAEAQAKAKK